MENSKNLKPVRHSFSHQDILRIMNSPNIVVYTRMYVSMSVTKMSSTNPFILKPSNLVGHDASVCVW